MKIKVWFVVFNFIFMLVGPKSFLKFLHALPKKVFFFMHAYPFSGWCPLKGHAYLNKAAVASLFKYE